MKDVYFNHDGGVDDLVSLFLLTQMDNVNLLGVGVIPTASFIEPAVSASEKIIDRFDKKAYYKIASSNSRVKNVFKNEWRMRSFQINALPILNEIEVSQSYRTDIPAHEHLIETVKTHDKKVTLLFTGPLTDLARALEEAPEIENNIDALYWTGGTFLEEGNVDVAEHDKTAEWNAFGDPEAVKIVFNTDIEINLITLESTDKVPLTPEVRDFWSKRRKDVGIDFIGQCYALVPTVTHQITNVTNFLWDVLTTVSVANGNDKLSSKMVVNCDVITNGPSQGRTIKTENGRPVNIIYDVNSNNFFISITKLAAKAK